MREVAGKRDILPLNIFSAYLLILAVLGTIAYGAWYQARQRYPLARAEFQALAPTRASRIADKILPQFAQALPEDTLEIQYQSASALFDTRGQFALLFVPTSDQSQALLFLSGLRPCGISREFEVLATTYVEHYLRNFSFVAYRLNLRHDKASISGLTQSTLAESTSLVLRPLGLSEVSFEQATQQALIPIAADRALELPLCE